MMVSFLTLELNDSTAMDTLLESVRMMASFKDRTIEPGCFLRESIGVNNSTFAIELSE